MTNTASKKMPLKISGSFDMKHGDFAMLCEITRGYILYTCLGPLATHTKNWDHNTRKKRPDENQVEDPNMIEWNMNGRQQWVFQKKTSQTT